MVLPVSATKDVHLSLLFAKEFLAYIHQSWNVYLQDANASFIQPLPRSNNEKPVPIKLGIDIFLTLGAHWSKVVVMDYAILLWTTQWYSAQTLSMRFLEEFGLETIE